MSDSIYKVLIKRATYISTGTLMARVFAAFAGILLARAVGPTLFGAYAAVWALISLSEALTQIGMKSGLMRDGAREPHLLPSLLGNTLFVVAFMSFCTLTLIYRFHSIVTKSELISTLYYPLAIAGFSTVCSEPIFAALYVKGHQKLASLIRMARGFIFLLGIGILAALGYKIETFAWFQGLLYATALVTVTLVGIRIVSIATNFSRILSQVKGSIVFGICSFFYSLYEQIPLLILAHFRSEEEVGYFAVSLRFVTLAILFGAVATNEVFFPSLCGLFKTNLAKFRRICEYMQNLFIPLGFFISCMLYIGADMLIILLQGEQYRPAVKILHIMCWAVAIFYSRFGIESSIVAGDRVWTLAFFHGCVSVLAFAVGMIAIGQYGIKGATLLILFLGLTLISLEFLYVYKKKLIGRFGLKENLIPVASMVISVLIIVNLLPYNNFLSPTFFFIFSSILICQKVLFKAVDSNSL